METEIDRFPVSELLARYSVGKSKLYADYLGQCKITPVKIQGRAYITRDDLKRLDDYHAAEGNGKEALAQFLETLKIDDDRIVVGGTESPASLSKEAVDCLRAIATTYTTACISQKMLLTVEEAVTLSGLSKAEVRRILRSGELPAIKEGGRWKVRPSDLRKCIGKKFDEWVSIC